MKCIRYLLSIIVLLFVIGGAKVSAVNTGFTTRPLTEEEKSKILPNINISLMKTEPVRGSIDCFDVNDSEMIAIGQSKGDRIEVCIYSQDGIFMYGYALSDNGSFEVEWDGNDLNIYFARGDLIVTVDRDGNIKDIAEVEYTSENRLYEKYVLDSTERNTDDARYYIRSDMGVLNIFAFSHSQLVMERPDGEEIIIYDVNDTQFARTIIGLIVVVSFFTSAIVIITKMTIRLNESPPQDE